MQAYQEFENRNLQDLTGCHGSGKQGRRRNFLPWNLQELTRIDWNSLERQLRPEAEYLHTNLQETTRTRRNPQEFIGAATGATGAIRPIGTHRSPQEPVGTHRNSLEPTGVTTDVGGGIRSHERTRDHRNLQEPIGTYRSGHRGRRRSIFVRNS